MDKSSKSSPEKVKGIVKGQNGRRAPGSDQTWAGQLGMTLVEVLVALGILAIVASVFLGGLTTSFKGVIVSHEHVTAESLAKSQMEVIKGWQYDSTNNPPNYQDAKLTDIPAGYDITITAERLNPKPDNPVEDDDGLQKITVTVTHNGKVVFTLEGYKVNRTQ